ncbi:MAG: hypothetical protein JSS02_13115 [Planctomycetes bacterium]|nr:hypothetical protein [Planctomycetota bacterium]
MAGTSSPTSIRVRFPACCLLVLAITALSAVPLPAGEFDDPEDTSTPTEGVLVMRDRSGTVVAGKITLVDEIYTVHGRYGNLQFPASDVRMRCSTLQDAYSRLHDLTAKHQSANSYMILARWCMANQLEKEAVEELNAALDLEPDRDDAKRMLQSLTEVTPQGQKRDSRTAENSRTGKADWPLAEEAVTLGGLSLNNALQYNRKIQPLIVKTCATAGCHTRESESSFQLYHVTPGKHASRTASEQNLAAILQQIDMKAPSRSPLLTVPRGKHGKNGRSVFAGPRGEQQFADLEQWVQDVAREESRRGSKTDEADARRRGTIRQTAATDAKSGEKSSSGRDPFAVPANPPLPFRGERRPRSMSDSSNADPFDPAAFNRQSAAGRK